VAQFFDSLCTKHVKDVNKVSFFKARTRSKNSNVVRENTKEPTPEQHR